jgi:hypothetical protein
VGGRCPECGGAFNVSDHRTFARRPPRLRLRWWTVRLAVLFGCLMLGVAVVPVWHWWGWHKEQRVIDELRRFAHVEVKRFEPVGPSRHLPARWAFLHERATRVFVNGDAEGRLGRLDLSPLVYLRWLELPDCHLKDDAIAQFRACKELDLLMLNGSPLDGSGLANVRECRKLTSLYLKGTRLNDDGLVNVGKLTALEELYIEQTRVTDAGMEHLAPLTSLYRLDLQDTAVTDVGILRLRGLKSLRSMNVVGTKVTERGKRELRTFLPGLRIYN